MYSPKKLPNEKRWKKTVVVVVVVAIVLVAVKSKPFLKIQCMSQTFPSK